ncbi:PiggyBac transposable element-derived protein 4, partial [Pseudolycoriella hygida]
RWAKFSSYWRSQWLKANISVYGLTDRTNNFCECLNSIVNAMNGPHPNIWKLISNLKLIEMQKSDELKNSVACEMTITKRRSKDMILLDARIKKATDIFNESPNVATFLKNLTYDSKLESSFKARIFLAGVDNDDWDDDCNEPDGPIIPNCFNEQLNFRTALLKRKAESKSFIADKRRELKVKWKKVPSNYVPRKQIPKYKEPEMRVEEDSTPVDLFFKLFPKKLFDWIGKCTNERLDILAAVKGEEAQHTDGNEIILVIGCLLVMGYNRLLRMQMYWSNNATLGNKAIKNAISRDRFLLLASKLYFNHPVKPKGADKLYYMEKLVKSLKHTFKRARSESTFQSVDETMVKFKGRWAGKQYMPQKKKKRGAKIWSRSDAMSGYCYDFNIYKGKEEGPAEGTLGERVVIKLCSTIGEEDVVVCTDRFFTSYQLMKSLPYACVGTCMANRKNVPILKEKLKKGESSSQSTEDGVICFKWQDTKEVLLMSNCHDGHITSVERKQKDGMKKTVACPEAISFYNKYMGGVDMTDQYTVLYDIDRKSNKWWKRVFQRLLMTAVTNAWVLYKQLKKKKNPLIDMLVPLAEDLIEIGKAGSKVQRSATNGRPSKKAKLFIFF